MLTLRIAFVVFILASVNAMAIEKDIKIALNWKPEAEFGGIYQAQVDGTFKKYDLKVEILPGGAGTPSVQMVAGAKLDFGIASADEIVIARSHGAKVVALFATYQNNAQGIMTHEELGYKSMADVFASTNKLALQKGLPYALFLQQKYQGAKAKIVPYLGGISNFLVDKNYAQQCFITSEPLSAEKKNQKVKTFLVADTGYNPYTTVLITREDVIKTNPSRVKYVVAAIREGTKAYLADPVRANIYMNQLNPSVDLETLKKSAEIQRSLIESSETVKTGLGTMTSARWTELVEQLLAMKLIKKKLPSDQMFLNM